ncbi:hypothetical protein IFM89_020579, partial [Coptis chinensis]
MEGNRKSPRKRKENNDDMQLEYSRGTQVGLDNLVTEFPFFLVASKNFRVLWILKVQSILQAPIVSGREPTRLQDERKLRLSSKRAKWKSES